MNGKLVHVSTLAKKRFVSTLCEVKSPLIFHLDYTGESWFTHMGRLSIPLPSSLLCPPFLTAHSMQIGFYFGQGYVVCQPTQWELAGNMNTLWGPIDKSL